VNAQNPGSEGRDFLSQIAFLSGSIINLMPNARRIWIHLLLAIMLVSLPACDRFPQVARKSDLGSTIILRQVDPVDTADPALDLIAVSTRQLTGAFEFTLSFLEGPTLGNAHVYLLVSTGKATQVGSLAFQGTNIIPWDLLIEIDPHGTAHLRLPDSAVSPPENNRVQIDREINTLTVSLPNSALSEAKPVRAQVFIVRAGMIIDATEGVSLGSAQSVARSSVLLAFWNTLPAASPAQALRRWNGAHTGPLGQRHGLYHILASAEKYQVPVALLDLNRPQSLFALQSMGQIDWLRKLQNENLILLPDVAYGDPAAVEQSTAISRIAAQSAGLRTSQFLYGSADLQIPDRYRFIFARTTDSVHILRAQNRNFIPFTSATETAPTVELNRNGLTRELKTALVQAALSGDINRVTVIGGNLPDSLWGDSAIAPLAFRYLSESPWIHFLTSQDLQQPGLSSIRPLGACQNLLCNPSPGTLSLYTTAGTTYEQNPADLMLDLRTQLGTLQPGPIADAAWDSYLQLTEPQSDTEKQKLQAQYLPSVYRLIDAARWARSPASASGCFDTGCVLASKTGYFWIDPLGGRIMIALAKTDHGVIQWLAPTSQYGVGLSDWDLSRGLLADSAEIPGGFSSTAGQVPFSVHSGVDQLSLTSETTGETRVYRLLSDGLEVKVEGKSPSTYDLPIPFVTGRLSVSNAGSAWKSFSSFVADRFEVPYPSGDVLSASISGAEWSQTAFSDSLSLFARPEDPDLEYPSGHFLPFPFAKVVIQSSGKFTAEFHIH
jgi:hypothetical protein